MNKLEITGERFHPEIGGKAAVEHFSRYSFSSKFLENKIVLDIACGEGYGSFFISKYASKVIGVDISKEAVNHARNNYSNNNLQYICSPIDNLPFEDNYFDVIVCFETIEHIKEQEKAIIELKRVITKGGTLIISTPDSYEYNQENNDLLSKFHENELSKSEFYGLLSLYFLNVKKMSQSFIYGAIIQQEEMKDENFKFKFADYLDGDWDTPKKEFLIAVASDSNLDYLLPSLIFNNYNFLFKEIDFLVELKQKRILGKFRYRLINFIFYPIDLIRKAFKS